jgi:uncharacterized protein (TIGR02246 family)
MATEEAIRRTLAAYCQTCDDGRFDEFVDLFAADAVFVVPPGPSAGGREAIRGFMEAGYKPEVRGKHLLGEPLITVSGESATALTDFVFVGRGDGGQWGIVVAGRYDDELRCESDGCWRFTRRTITML